MLIPSIDLMNGKAVQLVQGKTKVLERKKIIELAKEFSKYGDIAVIDLDAALGRGSNLELVKKICNIAPCRVGGGIRTVERANDILKAGAKKIIIGTRATPEFLNQFSRERIIVAVDTKNCFVVNEGWTRNTGKRAKELVKELEKYCSEFLFTNVDVEGLMRGCEIDKVMEINDITRNQVTAAGGITSPEEIRMLEEIGVNSQIGMALYTGKIKLDETFVSLLNFKKNSGLVPTIVQDDRKQVLMMAFSSKESVLKTFRSGKATYYSRSRKRIWTKGETSGNFQEFITARYDCDRDSLLFTVRQRNSTCHLGKYSCFGDKEFTLDELYSVILDRIKNPVKDSYTSRISKSEELIKEKIREEVGELLNYKNENNLVWEIADLTYFILTLMAKKNVTLKEVTDELWRRRK